MQRGEEKGKRGQIATFPHDVTHRAAVPILGNGQSLTKCFEFKV